MKNGVADEVAVFVIDHPDLDGRLAACAAAVMAERLPTPANELGLVAYVQWVCTDPQTTSKGPGALSCIPHPSPSPCTCPSASLMTGHGLSVGANGEAAPYLPERQAPSSADVGNLH